MGVKIIGDRSHEARNMSNVTFGKRGHIGKDSWSYKKSIEKTSKATACQGCVASRLDDGQILCMEAVISLKANQLIDA